MSIVSWKCVFCSVLFSSVVIALVIRTDATLEGSSMGYLNLPYSQEPVRVVRVSDVKFPHQGPAVLSRQKRNILFPSGVKLCAQETAQQVVANHVSYFHLRVCQETIWEAFKIFWDRLPEQLEYQSWMSKCQENKITAQDIGSYFSQSDEHQALVKKRMSQVPGLKSEPTRSWQHMCSTPTPDTSEGSEPPELEAVAKGEAGGEAAITVPDVEESTLDNDIAVQPPLPAVLEQVVELSILLTGEMYSDDLQDPASFQYQTLSRQLAEKIEDALQGLPGFKSVSVLDFRPQKDAQGLDGVVVDYAVTLAVDGTGVSTEQLDYMTLQSNLVENSYQEVKEHHTVVYTISEVKNVVTEALHKVEIESVSEIPESVNAEDRATVSVVSEPPEIMKEDTKDVIKGGILSEPSETNTMLTTENDVIILDESAVPVLITDALEVGSMAEEGLLLEDTVQTPAVEPPPPEELPAEFPSPELPEDLALPEPPVEVEASGSGTGDLEDLLQPAPDGTEEEEDISFEGAATDVGLITEDVRTDADVTSEGETKEAEVASLGEEPTAAHVVILEEKNPLEVDITETEIPGELEISIVTTETIEEGLPGLVLPAEVDVVTEASEPETAETGRVPVGEDIGEGAAEDSNLTHDPPSGEEVNPFAEAPEEAPEAPKISTEDVTEDEILLVNKDEIEPPLTVSLSPAQPTALSPERELPFTHISDVGPASDGQPDLIIPSLVEIQTTSEGLDDSRNGDQGYEVINYGYGFINHTEEGSTGFPFGVAHGTDQASIAMPVNPGRALIVFFSLRVTNMIFSEDLFNKSSPEYKALEQRFIELLVPYLQSNLSHFENLEILNFRNGSIVVNSRMKFGKPVPRGVTTTVYLILEDFCNTAYQTMNLAIDKYSLDVESGDQADPCKFQACNEYAECKVNKWSGEAECVCNAGYFSVDGLPCQSICELQTDFCLNDGKCDIIPGQGAICRCRVGENWWYRGEHCEEYVSEPLVVGIAITSVAGFLLVASGVIFFLARTLRDQYDKDESEDPIRRAESLPSLERATKYNPMFESEATTGYSHYYRRYPEPPVYSSASAEASTDFSSEEIRHIYENSELTKEEIQDRIRIIELYAKDRQFADFVRQHQAVLDTQKDSFST
ncbi:interphotoreceptor matrix proteoglycan 2 [Mastacembelus armatus]|uniref:interphotoreceptor matrix proteoglycan 2 n=1 Tax=Mastacembelus armatus TaxID=205130 RepID=UPI000E459172|nr:interphotoreceptor matrix proteoglycan 2 [Mastacembelus armatus]